MKNIIKLSALMVGLSLSSVVFADDEVTLKKSCIKDHPIVAGETDQAIIQIYAQICDKKNKDRINSYYAQAAQRFQKIGKNDKALQLVNALNAANIQHSSITDVKFLAGIAIANEALSQIRGSEVRYLTEETYAPALALAESINQAKPLSVIAETKVEEKSTRPQEYRAPVKQNVRTTTTTRRPTTTTKVTTTKKVTPAKVEKPAAPKRDNPFGSLN